jgi:hypothetical protein
VRFCAFAGLAGLLVVVFVFAIRSEVRAAPANAPLFQSGYTAPTDNSSDTGSGYEAPATDTPPANTGSANTPSGQLTPSVVFTETSTATIPPDLFRTEDSEINNSQTTLAASETPGPTITAVSTSTVSKTKSQSSPTPPIIKKKGGITLDWGLFWIGFSLPVLAACGAVLYLLDRRPDLFKHLR